MFILSKSYRGVTAPINGLDVYYVDLQCGGIARFINSLLGV